MININNYNNLYNYDDFIIKQEFPLNKESVINLANRMSLLKSNYFRDNNVYFTTRNLATAPCLPSWLDATT